MEDAFKMVVENEEVETVGDFVIRVTNELDATGKIQFLGYQTNRLTYFGPYDFIKLHNKFFIKHAKSESGGYGFSYFRSFNPQTPAIAFHFHVGNFGLVFFPSKKFTSGEIFKNQMNGLQFAQEVKKKFGFDVQGMGITEDGLAFEHINTSEN
jgi:hypothetical protein